MGQENPPWPGHWGRKPACLLGVAKRVITTYGRVRPDMGAGCPERFDWDFVKWVWHFNKRNRIRYHQALSQAENAKVYILKNRKQVRMFLEQIRF